MPSICLAHSMSLPLSASTANLHAPSAQGLLALFCKRFGGVSLISFAAFSFNPFNGLKGISEKISKHKLEDQMGIEKLVHIAVMAAMLAAATGQLPKFTMQVRRAQLQLLKDSRSSQWGHLMRFR